MNQILSDTFNGTITALALKVEQVDVRNNYAYCLISLKKEKDFVTVRFADKKFICGLFVKFILTV